MKITNNIFLTTAFILLSFSQVFAQESSCTNGIDDDGDGFIDCYDSDCAGGPSCSDFFYGNPIVCKDEPTANPTFQMKLQWGSEDRSADSHATPAIGDLDNDNLPEVVVVNKLDERLFILNGEDGTTAYTYDLGYQPENGIVLANLDGGDCANIYISRDNSSTITALDCEANLLWETSASDRVGIMGIADFNGDGNAELYYKTEIMDAATGNILVTGTNDNWVQKYAHSAIAVDILDDAFCADCSGLELITGNQIWAINIATGTRTLAKNLNDLFAADVPTNNKRYYTKWFNTNQNRTSISVADYNQDGHVDVLMPGAYGSSNTSQTTIFLWDVFNDTYRVYTGGVNHSKGTGRLNVADIDGDGLMNTTYVSDQILYALDENLNVLWTKGIDEGSSGFTGTTVFDFDGDGAAETIYRSESYLYIIDGTDGSTRTTIACKSRTQEEYPIVADVDNDGSSELCVPCYTSNNTPFNPYDNTKFSQIRLYEADGGEIWQPSRRVWNQHGYFNVNVNDDLTIPAQQQDHAAIFGNVDCETGAPYQNQALNGFLNQSTFLEADGCPSYVSPDVTMAGNITATPSLCPLTTFNVSFDIENTGDTDIYGNLPVTFYEGDPLTPGAIKLNTEIVDLTSGLVEGQTVTANLTVEGPGGDFDLYISLNNSGQSPPITLSGSGFPECDFSNNIGNISVTYTPFTLTVNKLEDNRRCDLTKPDNGEAEAYFEGTLGGAYETIWVEDFFGLSNGDRSDAGSTAWTSTKGSFNPRNWGVNTKSGNKVYRANKTGENNEVSEVTWLSQVIDISGHTDVDLSLEMLSNNTLEASGDGRDYMRAFYILDGGSEIEFDVNGELYGSFLYAVAEQEDLNGSTVQIKVTFHTTGNGEYHYLDNVQVSGVSIPVTQVYTDADGFEFNWYNAGDFSAPVASGSLNSGMATGSYDVVGFFPGGNCYSDTVNILINDSVPTFNVHVYEVNPYTDCSDPDGALAAFVYTQTDGSGDPADTLTSGYSFSWVLSTEGITPVGTSPNLTNLTSESYTVRVEQLITGCTSSASGAPTSSLVIPPDPTVIKTDIFACTGPGTTGSATASVGGITAGYSFEWYYQGVDGTPEHTGSSVTGLLEGQYYVVAIDNGSSCASGVVPFTIVDTSADPNPNAVAVQPDSGCDSNNGIATTDGDGAGTIAGYTFEWFVGNTTSPAAQLPAAMAGSSISGDGATASGLDNGLYTVRATIAGCESTDTVRIGDAEVVPAYNIITQVDAGNALRVLGKAIVRMPQLISGSSEFTMSYWVEISTNNYINDHRIFSSGGKNESQMMLWTSDEFGISFVIKADGDSDVGKINTFYKPTGWVQLTGTWNEATGEMKLYANGVKIGETTYFGDDPNILEGVIDNGPNMYIAGDGNFGVNKFEGRIDEVKVYNRALDETEILAELCDPIGGSSTGLLAHYNFNDVGLNTTQGSNVPDVSGNGNNGTLTKPGAGSPGSWAYVTSGIQCPLAGMVNNTSCDPANPNGIIDLTDAVDPIGANYEYTVYEGTEVDTDTTFYVNSTGIFTGLKDGFYTIVTQDQSSLCETDPLTLSIATLPEQPSIITSITDNTGCTIGAGEILVTSSSVSAEPADYTYELYDGWTYTTMLQDEIVPDGTTGFNFTGLTTGEYRVRVINNDILCEDYVDVYVDDASVAPSFNDGSTIVNHNTVCSGTPNGFASVAVNGNIADFDFEWYDGGSVVLANIRSETDEFLEDLAAGQYTVVATSTLTGCPTPPKTITIFDQPIYPAITTQVVTEQTACDYGNGTLYAFVTELSGACVECIEPDDYSFQWYLGNDTSTPLVENTPTPGNGSIPIGADSSVVTGLVADDYTVVVINNLTGCSDTTSATMTYNPMPPTIDPANSTITDNTSCVAANGEIIASVDFSGETINGAVNASPWEVITDCNTEVGLDSNILPDGSIEITADVNNQAGKAYLGDSVDFNNPTRIDFWMYLGDKDAGADGITFIFHRDPAGKDALGRYGCNLGIGDEPCFGGTETAIAPSIAVEFDTYNNGGPTKDPAYDHTAFVVNGEMNLPQGDVGVFYNANQPTIVLGQNDVEAADQELRVTITIVPNMDGTQTFSVYVEDELRLQRTQDFINDLFGGESKTIAGYTASTGGQRNQQYVRIDPYFGEYNFAWYEGGVVDEANRIPDESSPYLCDLFAGDYTYVVTYNGTGCESDPATFTVDNATDTADVALSGVQNTVCDPALAASGAYTGSLTANTASVVTNYTFAWFEGTSPTADTIATTQTLAQIAGGDYTVVVQNIVSGCVRVKDTTLADVTIDPAIVNTTTDVTVQNVTACEGGPTYPNGSITVNTVGIGVGPFGFWYYYGADTTTGTFLTDADDIFDQIGSPETSSVNVSGNGTATLSNLSEGDYTIIVLDSASGCTSVEANVQIINVPTIPSLDQNMTPNTVCDITANNSGEYDGEVEIFATDGSNEVTEYTYFWYDGTGTTTPTVYNDNINVLSEALDGNYTVVATSLLTGCDTTIYATIGDATVDPVVNTVTPTPMSVCDGSTVYPNGTITVDDTNITNGSGDYSYAFYWGASVDVTKLISDGDDIVFEKTGVAGGVLVDIADNVISNLDTGFYTVVVIDNVTGCPATEFPVEIDDTLIPINIAESITHWTNCDAPDGEITVTPTMSAGSEPTGGYTYQWYYGSGTTNTLDASDLTDGTALTGVTTANVSGLEDGTYTVEVTNVDTQCPETAEFDIEDNRVYPVITPANIVVTDNVNCSGTGTGIIDPTSAVSVAGPYLFTLYTSADVVITTSATTFTGLSAGNYKVGVELTGTGCETVSTVAVTVDDDLTNPAINQSIVSHETSCIAPNGQISIASPGGITPTGGWDINLYQGSGAGGALQENLGTGVTGGFPILSTANLDNGLYTIQIINNQTGCDSLREITILEQPIIPTLNSATKTDNTFCVGANGSVTITGVTGAGASPTYNLYFGSTADGTPDQTSATTSFTGLANGTYTVTVTHGVSGCESNGLTRTVAPAPTTFTPGVTVFSDQTSCLASDPNGELHASIAVQGTGPSTNVTDYDFEWYQGQNTNPANRINTAGIISTAIVGGTNGSEVSGLPTGTYRLKVIEPVSGCFYTVDGTIGLVNIPPAIPGGGVVVNPSTQCAPGNGSIQVTVNDGGSTQPYDGAGGYTFSLFSGTIGAGETPLESFNQMTVTETPGPGDYQASHTFTDLEEGDYTVRIRDNNTSCLVTSTLQVVGYAGPTIDIDPANMNNNPLSVSCFNNDGELNIGNAISNISSSYTDNITITWFIGTDTSNVNNTIANMLSAQTPSVVFNDVVVLNNNGDNVTIVNGEVLNLPAVSYTGVVELSNGCQYLINTSLSIADAPEVVAAVSTPLTRCSMPYDGEVTITIDPLDGFSAAGYDFFLFEGDKTIIPDDGFAPFNPALDDVATYGTPVAQGTFDDNGTGAGVANLDTELITGLDSGQYTLGIRINDGDECITNVLSITVDPPAEPDLTFDSKIDNSICDITGALDYNGSITVDASHPSGGTFDFEWYYDADGDGDFTSGQTLINADGSDEAGTGSNVVNFETLAANTATISGVGPGWYRALATHNSSDCPDTLDIEIIDDFLDLTLNTVTTLNDITSCAGGPNEFGEFEVATIREDMVELDASSAGLNFDITWEYDNGGGFAPYLPNIDQNHSDDLAAGDYRISIVSTTTGCDISYDFSIEELTEDPIIELVLITENTTCPGGLIDPTGAIEVRLVDDSGNPVAMANYDIEWYDNAGLTSDLVLPVGLEAGANNEQATQLAAGEYWVEVTDNTDPNQNCVASASYVVVDNPPTLSIESVQGSDYTKTPQTDCVPENGTYEILRVMEEGSSVFPITDYTFDWFANSTGTQAITVTSPNATFPGVGGANGPEVADLLAGTYYVAATSINNDCVSDTISFTIQDQRLIPSVQIAQVLPDTTCVGSTIPSGEVTASVILAGGSTGNPGNYDFTWYEGLGTGTPITVGTPSGVSNETYSDLPAGVYTVEVEDMVTPGFGCIATASITVSRFTPIISIATADINIAPDTDCTGDNGSATVNAITVSKYGGGSYKIPSADFNIGVEWDFIWYDDPISSAGTTYSLTNAISNEGADTYYIELSNLITGCAMATRKAVTIQQNTKTPLVQLVSKTPDEYCTTVANEGDGALSIKIVHEGSNPANSANYNIEWFRGTGTTTPLAGSGSALIGLNDTTLTQLSADTYTVRVTDANTPNLGCATTQTFTILRDAPTYSLPLSAITKTNNFNCDNPNGTITLEGINIDGVFEDFAATTDNYTINWPSLPGGAIITPGGIEMNNDQVTNLEGGTYQVNISNDRTGCTVSANINLTDVTSNPLVQLVIKQADEYCDNTGFVGNGSLEMRIVHEGNNPADPLDYVIDWYRGTGTGTTLASTAGSSVILGNGTILSGLSTDTYTVVVTKNGTPNDQCLATTTFSIVKDAPQFSIQSSSVQVTDNTNCTNPNGTIQITNVVTDGVVTDLSTVPVGTYSFDWIPVGLNGGFNTTVNENNDRAEDLPAGEYRIVASNVATGCATDTVVVTIQDQPIDPQLSFVVDAVNSNCGPTKNGQLTVTATTADGNPVTNVGRYAFTWYDGQGTAVPTTYIQNDGIGANDNQSTLLALDSGYYTVSVFDNVNECTISGTFAVGEQLDNPQVLLSDIVVRADTTCNVGSSGTIIVADSSFVSGVLDDYDVEIRSGSATGAILAQSVAGGGNTDLTFSALDPGTYYVTATRASSECDAAPVRVNILDQRFPPAIVLDTLIANPNCGGGIAMGSIGVTADGFDETNPNYIFQWYVGTIAGGIVVPNASGSTATVTDVAEGQYELSVTNVNTGCIATQIFDLPAVPVNPRISSYGVSNNLICDVPGDGNFEVNQVRWNGVVLDAGITADSLEMVTNYTFEYYSNPGLTTAVVDIDLSTPLELDGLSAGTYYARVRRNDSQCASGPIEFIIQDIPQYPVIQLSQIEADSTCNSLNPNGTLSALVDGVTNDTLYTYDWYEVDPGTGIRISGSLSTNDTISGLPQGRYELEVNSILTGCISTAQRNVTNAPVEVEILGVTGTDPTTCSPSNGIVEVNAITPGVLTDYTFDFFLGEPGNGGVNVQSGLGPVYATAEPGAYYVQATHDVYGCTYLYEIELEDNLIYPIINLTSFVNQTNCDPGNPNGELAATADGSTDNTVYTFEWRNASNVVVEPNNATITNIPAGEYTLNVLDNTSGCSATSTFEIIDDYPDPLELVISTSPNANCVDPNGEVSATIRNLVALGKPITNYQFYWFIGDQTASVPDIANPDYFGTLITDLPDGDYTVYAVDATDVFCTSDPTLVTIQDNTFPPPFDIEVQNHVTICYDSLPNGRARINPNSIETSREFFEFRYEWFVGTAADTAGQTPFVTGIRADSLDIGTYSVLATDRRTGCENFVSFDIIDATEPVPPPSVNVISDRDNCLFPNGHAVASISGVISGYRFDWYLASGSTVEFTGHEIFTLDAVDYEVQATRLSTGCVSPRTPVNVEFFTPDTTRTVVTTTSLCLRTEDGALNQFTGTAEIVFSQFAAIKEIDWIDPNGDIFSNDIKLVNAQPGRWTVRYVTDNDCEFFNNFTIQTALKIYNGVSANADGLNDYFFVDCIDYFPNNFVQIFNRDGTKVWENPGYDNMEVRFEGFSNVGRSGLQLPAGTYFYIISKGPQEGIDDENFTDDTNRPRIQGYLELVR